MFRLPAALVLTLLAFPAMLSATAKTYESEDYTLQIGRAHV